MRHDPVLACGHRLSAHPAEQQMNPQILSLSWLEDVYNHVPLLTSALISIMVCERRTNSEHWYRDGWAVHAGWPYMAIYIWCSALCMHCAALHMRTSAASLMH